MDEHRPVPGSAQQAGAAQTSQPSSGGDTTRPVLPDQDLSARYWWHRQTIAETFDQIIAQPEFPWVAIGDFLDEWRRSEREDRLALVEGAIASHDTNTQQSGTTDEVLFHQRWAAFCAATVEWLCWQSQLPWPSWTGREEYYLQTPWFLYPGDLLRPWQLVSTPAPFKMRNIFGGDRFLDRV